MSRVELRTVPSDAAPILSNLLELYCHDLSAYFGLKIGPDGRFGYPHLPLYWQELDRRFPFFIVADAQLAGFVLVTRGSPATHDPFDLDVAEFFVLRAHRAKGIGARAATQLWNRYPGHWVVRAALANAPAVSFWRSTISAYLQPAEVSSTRRGGYVERTLELSGIARQVFEFDG